MTTLITHPVPPPSYHSPLRTVVETLRATADATLAGKVITVLSPKGGQGKSTLAKELAWILNGVLVDLDWDGGRVSRLLGYLTARYQHAPLLDALYDQRRRTPRLYRSRSRPDMIPGHKDFEANQPEPEHLAELLLGWAEDLRRCLVIDTHPGGSNSAFGAAEAADLVLMPVILGTGELDAVEEALHELAGFPLLLVPNRATNLPAAESRRLLRLADTHNVAIAETRIRRHDWMTLRKRRTVVSASATFGAQTGALTTDMTKLAREVIHHVR